MTSRNFVEAIARQLHIYGHVDLAELIRADEQKMAYAVAMSDAFYELDKGNKKVEFPPCSDIIEIAFGCLESR